MRRIATDLTTLGEYPGFPETGRLILRYLQSPELLKEVHPLAQGKLSFGLADLISRKVLGTLQTVGEARGVESQITHKVTSQTQKAVILEPRTWIATVLLDNGFELAPKAAQRLILVKEACQLGYIPQLRHLMVEEVLARYDVTVASSQVDLPTILYTSSVTKPQFKQIPNLTNLSDNGQKIADGTGYFHTTPALGRMWRQNLFNSVDLDILDTNYSLFRLVWGKGLLREKEQGVFGWKEGVTAFSKEWLDLAEPYLKDGLI